jgi:glyoxylase-like metal-dependent hydrolase (beta-lactamase superfamily II)
MFRVSVVEGSVLRFVMARRLLGKDLYRSACYLVDGLLVDSGIPHLSGKIAKALSGHHISAIVNTHAHEDHMGANAILQQSRRLPVFAHRAALPTLSDPGLLVLLPYQRVFFGKPLPSTGEPLGDVLHTERRRFRVIHSPGHSPDHVVLHDAEKGWIFSGDAFIGGQDRVFRSSYDIGEMVGTLRNLASLGAEVLFTGMGNVVRNPARQIERKLSYYEEMSHRVRKLVREGMDEPEVASLLFPGDRTVRFVTSGNFSAEHLVRSFLTASEYQ